MNTTETPALCDGCTRPTPNQQYMGYGIMLCDDCRQTENRLHEHLTLNTLTLAGLDARTAHETPHDVQRTAGLIIAMDTLLAAWNGEFDDDDFKRALQRTAEQLATLIETVKKGKTQPMTKVELNRRCPRCRTHTYCDRCPRCHYKPTTFLEQNDV